MRFLTDAEHSRIRSVMAILHIIKAGQVKNVFHFVKLSKIVKI